MCVNGTAVAYNLRWFINKVVKIKDERTREEITINIYWISIVFVLKVEESHEQYRILRNYEYVLLNNTFRHYKLLLDFHKLKCFFS